MILLKLTNGYSRQKPFSYFWTATSETTPQSIEAVETGNWSTCGARKSECSFHASGSRRCLLYHQTINTIALANYRNKAQLS